MPVPAYTFLLLSGAVFTLGAIGFMVRRNPLVAHLVAPSDAAIETPDPGLFGTPFSE